MDDMKSALQNRLKDMIAASLANEQIMPFDE